jgi:hypothetical protein
MLLMRPKRPNWSWCFWKGTEEKGGLAQEWKNSLAAVAAFVFFAALFHSLSHLVIELALVSAVAETSHVDAGHIAEMTGGGRKGKSERKGVAL